MLTFDLKRIKGGVKQYLTKERWVALNLLGRMVILTATMAVVPAGIAQSKQNVSAPVNIKFDRNSQEIVKLAEPQVQIVIGESNYDREERQKRLASGSRSVVVRDSRPAPYDPDLSTKRALVKKAAAKYGINWKILEAVWQVETGKSWDTEVRSYAGAQGPWQFLPSTFRHYAESDMGNIYSAEDGAYAAARLLAASGADRGDNISALLSYNHSMSYVNKVQGIADSIQE